MLSVIIFLCSLHKLRICKGILLLFIMDISSCNSEIESCSWFDIKQGQRALEFQQFGSHSPSESAENQCSFILFVYTFHFLIFIMLKIRFSYFSYCAILQSSEITENEKGTRAKGFAKPQTQWRRNEMSKKNTNVMACGCAVIIEEDGQITTSVDRLFNAINRLRARSNSRQAQGRTAAARA